MTTQHLTFNEFLQLNLNPKTVVLVEYDNYTYVSTARWVSAVYKNFPKLDEIRFSVEL